MPNKLINILDRLALPSNRSIYLSIFRMYVAFHILKKILLQWNITDILYQKTLVATTSTSYFGYLNLDYFRNHLNITVYIFMILAVLYAFGIGKQITGILLFTGVQIFQRMNEFILNGGDNLLVFLLLLIACLRMVPRGNYKTNHIKSRTYRYLLGQFCQFQVISTLPAKDLSQ